MKRMKKLIAVTLFMIAVFGVAAPVYAQAVTLGDHELSSQGAIVIDCETGVVLFGLSENTRRVPASTIKVLAVYVVYDAIKAGKASLSTKAVISASTSEFSRDRTWSNVPLNEGASFTIRELLEVVLIRSACAATVALGEAVFGSEKNLITRMKEKATQLGIDVRIYDSWGGSPDNRISPKGLAEITRGLIRDYPEVLDITSKRNVTFNGVTYGTSNLLLGSYNGLDGFKTGFTNPAGYCFIGTALRNGRRLISVTMGSSLESRYPDTKAMLDYGFAVADEKIDIALGIKRAKPSDASLVIDGVQWPLTAYLIDDYHYFKLRDVAFLLSGTEKQFGASWDAETSTAVLTSGDPYESVGGELASVEDSRPYTRSGTVIYINDILCALEIYMIDNNNYFRLRDMAELFDFSAIWIDETRTVIIDTSEGFSNAA